MHIGAVAGAVREGSDIDEEEEPSGKLSGEINCQNVQVPMQCVNSRRLGCPFRVRSGYGRLGEKITYQCTRSVDTCVAHSRIIEPLRL